MRNLRCKAVMRQVNIGLPPISYRNGPDRYADQNCVVQGTALLWQITVILQPSFPDWCRLDTADEIRGFSCVPGHCTYSVMISAPEHEMVSGSTSVRKSRAQTRGYSCMRCLWMEQVSSRCSGSADAEDPPDQAMNGNRESHDGQGRAGGFRCVVSILFSRRKHPPGPRKPGG